MEKRRMCPHCRAFITTSDRVCPYCSERVGPRAVERREGRPILGGFIPHAHFTTVMILLVNLGLFLLTAIFSVRSGNESGWGDVDGNTLSLFGAKDVRYMVLLGQWWRLITAGFLHGGVFHILMNSWVLFDLGAQVEEIYGAHRMIVFYIAATIGGFLASTYWSPYISVGASAGVFGLIGAMIALGARQKSSLGSAIRGFYIRWAIYGFLLGLLPGLAVDNAAHLGGLAAGFVVAYLAGTPGSLRGDFFWRVLAYLCLVLTAASFLQMYLWFIRATAASAT